MLNSKKSKMLEARNKYNNKEEEIVFGEYKRSFLGYFMNLLVGVGSLKYLLFPLIVGLMYLFKYFVMHMPFVGDEWDIFMMSFLGLAAFCWLCRFIVGLAEWKYTKYFIVTNQGLWFMNTSRFWRKKDWRGKKTFLGPHWNIYSWDELDDIEVFTDRIARIHKLKNLKLYRWDGSNKLYYFSAREVDDILAYSREQYKPKKRKKANKGNLPRQIRFFNAVERFFSGDNDEI